MWRGETVADDLVEAEVDQQIAGRLLAFQRQVGPLWGHLVGHNGTGDFVVAVDAGDLFHQVGLPDDARADVHAMVGHGGVECVAVLRNVEFEPPQDVRRRRHVDVHAQQPLHLAGRQFDFDRLRRLGVVVDDAFGNLAAPCLSHQFDAALEAANRLRRMYAPAESCGRVGVHLLRPHGAADVDEIPVGRLQEHVARLFADFGFRTTDNAAQAEHTFRVTDEDVVRF